MIGVGRAQNSIDDYRRRKERARREKLAQLTFDAVVLTSNVEFGMSFILNVIFPTG